MRTLREILEMLDAGVNAILSSKLLSKEEFIEKYSDEEMYSALKNSKAGLIEISYLDGTNKHNGFTAALGEGIACRMSNENNWYTTSTIKSIDWNNKTFETLNSIYKFEFQEIPLDKALASAKELYNQLENDSKNKETK